MGRSKTANQEPVWTLNLAFIPNEVINYAID